MQLTHDEARSYLGKFLAHTIIRMEGTQMYISKFLGVSVTTVSNILNGYYERVSIRMYMRLAIRLGLVITITIREN